MSLDTLTTRILVRETEQVLQDGGIPTTRIKREYGSWAEWKSSSGSDEDGAGKTVALERASVTIRYRKAFSADSEIYLSGDSRRFTIVGPVTDVNQQHRWLTFKVQREVPA